MAWPLRLPILYALCFALPAMANPRLAPQSSAPAGKSPYRIGLELELTLDSVANLTGYFDFEKLQAEKFSPELSAHSMEGPNKFFQKVFNDHLTDNYLRNNSAALDALPPEFRAKLTKGLNLGGRVIVETESPKPAFLDRSGKAMDKRPSILLPDAPANGGHLILPGDRPSLAAPSQAIAVNVPKAPVPDVGIDGKLFNSSGALTLPNRFAWDELYKRWEEVPVEKRWAVMRWDLLGPLEKAALALQYPDIELREDISADDKKLFDKLTWERDGDALEFKYREDVKVHSVEEFLGDLRALARRAGVEREVFDPMGDWKIRRLQTRARQMGLDLRSKDPAMIQKVEELAKNMPRWGSLHYHQSEKGKKLKPLVEAINDDLLVKRLELGIVTDLTREGGYNYSRDISYRAIVRAVKEDHFETRTHHEPLEERVKYISRLVQDPDPVAAAAGLRQETATRITRELLEGLVNQGGGGLPYSDTYPRLLEILRRERPGELNKIEESILADFHQAVRENRLLAAADHLRFLAKIDPLNPTSAYVFFVLGMEGKVDQYGLGQSLVKDGSLAGSRTLSRAIVLAYAEDQPGVTKPALQQLQGEVERGVLALLGSGLEDFSWGEDALSSISSASPEFRRSVMDMAVGASPAKMARGRAIKWIYQVSPPGSLERGRVVELLLKILKNARTEGRPPSLARSLVNIAIGLRISEPAFVEEALKVVPKYREYLSRTSPSASAGPAGQACEMRYGQISP